MQRDRQKITSEGQLIDWPALLNRFRGDAAFIEKLAKTTLATQKELPGQIREAAQSADLVAVSSLAHKLKSMAGYLESGELAELAKKAEAFAREGQTDAFELALRLADGFESLLAELARRYPVAEPRDGASG